MTPNRIEECKKMLAYLGITRFKCKYYAGVGAGKYQYIALPIRPEENRYHKVFILNIDGTLDYAGYLSHSSDRWITEPDIEVKNITSEAIINMLYDKLTQKVFDKARALAMKQYLNRQLCIGGLGFLIQ